LARIKKIMKLDDDVKMISAEAPVLFSKAAELFITELTLRAWIHTEDNKRRTLQRNDIAMAISKYDQFDFLIDIVPRDELKPHKAREEPAASKPASNIPDQVQYYLQLAQQNQQALQQSTQQPQTALTNNSSLLAGQQQSVQIIQSGNQIQNIGGIGVLPTTSMATATNTTQSNNQQSQQLVVQGLNLNQQQQLQQQQQQQQQQQLGSGIQIVQQIVGPNGEIQQIPLQLSPQQLQMIRMQLGGNNGQQLILQSSHAPQQNQSE